MAEFRSGALDVLVATTVIEVGVDIPEASGDGHRGRRPLRHRPAPPVAGSGRAGRASRPGATCCRRTTRRRPRPASRPWSGPPTASSWPTSISSLRGEGTILGARQKGRSDLRLAKLLSDRDLVVEARDGGRGRGGAGIPGSTTTSCWSRSCASSSTRRGRIPVQELRFRSRLDGGGSRRWAGGRPVGWTGASHRWDVPRTTVDRTGHARTVRPTTDRVREAVFDILFSLGGVDGMQVADLFAGSGAMGIEALSRGAVLGHLRRPASRRPGRGAGQPGRRRVWPTPSRTGTPPWSGPMSTRGWPPPPRATTSSSATLPTATTGGTRWSADCRAIWPSSNPAPRSRRRPGGGSSNPSDMGVRS